MVLPVRLAVLSTASRALPLRVLAPFWVRVPVLRAFGAFRFAFDRLELDLAGPALFELRVFV